MRDTDQGPALPAHGLDWARVAARAHSLDARRFAEDARRAAEVKAAEDARRVAVLPFSNMSGNPDLGRLGVCFELIGGIGRDLIAAGGTPMRNGLPSRTSVSRSN